MAADDKQAFVAALAQEHGERLRRFLASRLRHAGPEIPDLVQEIYLRILRVPDHQTIRSPRSYLFTVAYHVMNQHKLNVSAAPETVDVMDLASELESFIDEDPATQLDARQRLESLEHSLKDLPPKAAAALMLHRRYGYSLDEIAVQFGVSRDMVKKHLARAVAHCRLHRQRTEST